MVLRNVPGNVRRGLHRAPPAPVVLLGMFSLHTGSALAVHVFDTVGAAGITWLRLSWTALVLVLVAGPRLVAVLRRSTPRDLAGLAALGTASGAMMLSYSEAAARIDLGTATALEFLGPLAVALGAMRGLRQALWVAAAVVGVVCLTTPWSPGADLAGVGFALSSGACLGVYIVLTQRVGARFGVLPGLAASMVVAAAVSAPLGAPAVLADGDLPLLAITLGLAALFPLVPYLAEMAALRRMGRGAFATFISLDPAVGLLMGLAWLGQVPALVQIVGIALVVAAGMGAARDDTRSTRQGRRAARSARVEIRHGYAKRHRTAAGL